MMFQPGAWTLVGIALLGSLAAYVVDAAAAAAASYVPPSPPSTTDYISCSDPCNGGDVNYELTATIRTVELLNVTYRGRMYANPENPESIMGPTMRVKPGQSLWIKFRNEMYNDHEDESLNIGSNDVTVQDYWTMLQNPGEKIKYQYYKKAVNDPSLMTVDEPNIPKNFENTNLHLHGLDIAVHMFDPVGTHRADAPHVNVKPGQCYCYRFDIPDHHPTGLYWYHPHLHGSSAVQLWSGMMGLLYVEDNETDIQAELHNKYGVTNTQEFTIWDPAFQNVTGRSHHMEVDEFLKGQTTLSKIHPYLVNGEKNPTLQAKVGEVLHLRTLCGTIENENTFIIFPEGTEDQDWRTPGLTVPFYVVASDGVTYSEPVKHDILVMAGGQREEILVNFDTPGRYVISQQGIQGMQFFDMYGHPHDQILATIEVAEADEGSVKDNSIPPIEEWRFTPGYDESERIKSEDIVKTETIVFSMGANRDQAPFPQYYINGKSFQGDRIDFTAHPGEAVEYILVNANHNVHPFHIHVNRFQVQEMGSELSTEKYPALKVLLTQHEPHVWRDTVVIPPNGRTRIWVQYKEYTGKTVFHCHFLAHEDTGMMSTLFIGEMDYVFNWREHQQLVIGVGVGVLVAVMIGAVFAVMACGKHLSYRYEVVATMNSLKSKVQD